MRAIQPNVEILGDNQESQRLYSRNEKNYSRESEVRPFIMARSGTCVGMNKGYAVWRFGFRPASEAGQAYGISVPEDRGPFFWFLTIRKDGEILDEFEGAAINLPTTFRRVIEQEQL